MEATATLLLGAWRAVGKNFIVVIPLLDFKSRINYFSVNRFCVYLSDESLSVKITLFLKGIGANVCVCDVAGL
jgi:hypothetical protein